MMNPPPTSRTPTVNGDELLHIVTLAASQIPEQLKASTDRLKVLLDTHAGTYNALHRIAADPSQPLQVRQQSIIQFKNAALSHWRSRKLMSEDDRIQIRHRSFTFLSEADDTIAECNELIIGKIARLDYPHNWPSLFNQLMPVVQEGLLSLTSSPNATIQSTLSLRRSLKVLNSVIKEFSNMKMLTGIKIMSQVTDQLRNIILEYYSRLSPTILSIGGLLEQERIAASITVAHLVYKCLMRMALWSWPRITRDVKGELTELKEWFLQLFQSSTAQLRALSELRINLILALRTMQTSGPITTLSIDRLTRHIRIFGKFFKRLQQLDPFKFVELPTCNEMVLYYWSKVVEATDHREGDMIQDSSAAVYPVRFLVQAMVLFKENLARWTPFRKGGPVTETTLSQQFVEHSVQLLVTRFIPLNPSDLKGWMADPEEWVNEEDKENEQWEFELRPCGERVLMTLAAQYRDYVVPLMESTFKEMIDRPTADLASIIQKEALYCAIGRCATKLRDVIPFNEWMRHKLVVEARETDPNFPIIKRRIAWMIGKWIGDMCVPASDPVIWEILVHLLQDRGSGSDAVVRLTAANAVRECVNTVGFDAAVFSPFLPATVTELLKLVSDADTMEMKQRLARNLKVVIECVDQQIVPHIQMIAEQIPTLWTAAGEEWLFKAQLLEVMKSLIMSSKEFSASLVPLVIPLVQESLSPGVAINLDEDGVNLWLAALRNSTSLQSNANSSLLQLFPLAMALLSCNLDLLGKITYIVESYFFVDAFLVLQTFSLDLMNAFMSVMRGQALQTNQRGVLNCVNFMMQLAPSSLWGEAVLRSGFFNHVIKILGDDESSSAMLTECVFVLARIALIDREMFIRLVSLAAQVENVHEAKIWEIILDQFWRQFDHMSEPRHRKLLALGIASLVSTGRPEVLERVPNEVFNLWTDVLYEVRESRNHTEDGEDGGLNLYWDVDNVPASYYAESQETLEYYRRKSLLEHDPVRTLQLTTSIASALQASGEDLWSAYIQARLP
ncbi:ARM repeat-containing protein [Boletus edulis BED1]|uniref:ARM repeat-containing protein n=1 Tax=Boletus edulis BED1 TaxID=1328754 RepID=A0AAD4C677_BOLED|nr:ARM repeat-containing protein [Boletus edulis BED1]